MQKAISFKHAAIVSIKGKFKEKDQKLNTENYLKRKKI